MSTLDEAVANRAPEMSNGTLADPEKASSSANEQNAVNQQQDGEIVDWQGPDDPENPL